MMAGGGVIPLPYLVEWCLGGIVLGVKRIKLLGSNMSVRFVYRGAYKFLTPDAPIWEVSEEEFKLLKKQIEHMLSRGWIEVEEEQASSSGVTVTDGDVMGDSGNVVTAFVKEEVEENKEEMAPKRRYSSRRRKR